MIPTAQNVCGPLCGYTIEELRVKSVWAPGGEKVGAGSETGGFSVDLVRGKRAGAEHARLNRSGSGPAVCPNGEVMASKTS